MLPVRGTPAAVFLSLLFLVSVLAGCVDSEPQIPGDDDMMECLEDMETEACPDPDVLSDDGRDLRTELTIEDSVPAPRWEVGDLFGQHIYDGPGDTSGYHIDSVVVEDTGSAWVIAPNDEELARRHAYWDYPFLGEFKKDGLATSAYGNDWDFFFDFPLEHNKSWKRQVEVPHPTFFWWNTYDVTFHTEYAASVETFEGKFPGFHITGTTADDRLLFSYYYVPKIEWYDQFHWYDLTTDDPDDYRLRAISMGTGKNWTGTTYVTDLKQNIDYVNFFCPSTDAFCHPTKGADSFVLAEGTRLFGVIVMAAWGGTSHAALHPPEGSTRTYDHTYTDVPDPQAGPEDGDIDASTTFTWYDEDAVPGEWRIASGGAGPFWGTFIRLIEIAIEEVTLGGE